MKKPIASIVVPLINWKQTDGFISSLISCGLADMPPDSVELIVMDNGPDPVWPTSLKEASEDPRIRFVRALRHSPTAPLHRSWNVGATYSAGHNIIVVNDDIIWGRRSVFNFCRALHLFKPSLWCCYPTPASTAEEALSLGNVVDRPPTLVGPPEFRGWAFAFSRLGWEEVGPFDEDFELLYGDDDCWMRTIEAGHPARQVDNAILYHLGSQSLWTVEGTGMSYNRDAARFKEKWGGRTGQDFLKEKGFAS